MGLTRRIAVATAVSAAVVLTPAAGLAQAGEEPCPDLAPAASAAKHAVCWFERHDVSEPSCDVEGTDRCLQQAVRWCESAALDEPRVATACFVGALRAGQLETAAEVAEYVTEPSAEIERCREAVTGMPTARIVTTPKGGEVVVDGREYGAAPVEVSLPSPWWERRVEVRFGEARVEVPEEQLVDAFDPRACDLDDVVVEGPGRAAAPVTAEAAEPRAGPTVLGWTLIGAGGAMGIAALATGLVADVKHSDLSDACVDGICTPEHQSDISKGRALARTSTAFTFLGIASAGAGLIVLIIDGAGGEQEQPETQQAVRLAPGPGTVGIGLEGQL